MTINNQPTTAASGHPLNKNYKTKRMTMTTLLRTVALCVLTLCSAITHASDFGVTNVEKFEADIKKARAIYMKTTGDEINKRDVRKAVKHMDKLSRKYPKHPLVMIYKGSSLAQRGRDIGARPLDRMRETEEGLLHVDRGLKIMERRDINFISKAEGQLLAAFLFIHLPDSIFHRLNEGEHLIQTLINSPHFHEYPSEMQGVIYYAAAISAEKHGDIPQQKHFLKESLKANPEGEDAEVVKEILDTIQ